MTNLSAQKCEYEEYYPLVELALLIHIYKYGERIFESSNFNKEKREANNFSLFSCLCLMDSYLS